MTLVISWAFVVCGTAMSGRRLGQPLTNNGSGLVRVSLGQFADAMDRLRMDLALNLGDVDHLRGGIGTGNEALAGARVVAQRRQMFVRKRGDHFGSKNALDQR